MTKKQLLDTIEAMDCKDDDTVVIMVHDTTAYEDCYDFYVDAVYLNPLHNNHESEIQLTLINHNDND